MEYAASAISAYQQGGFILIALILFAIGAAIMADHFRWRAKAAHIKGIIKGVRVGGTIGTALASEVQSTPETSAPKATWVGFFKYARKNLVGGFFGLLIAFIIYGLPLILICFGIYRIENYAILKMTGLKAEAVVVRNDIEAGDKGSMYRAIIDFNDLEGRPWEVKDSISSGSPVFAEGSKIAVYYDPMNPAHYVIDNFLYVVGFSLLFMGLGFGFLFAILGLPKLQSIAKEKKIKMPPYSSEGCYYPSYEYVTPMGVKIQAESGSGSSNLANKEPGKKINLLVMSNNPQNVREVGIVWLVVALCFLSASAVLFCIAFGAFHTSIFTPIAVAVFIVMGISKAVTHMKPRAQRGTVSAFINSSISEIQAKRAALPLLDHAAWVERMRWRDALYKKYLPWYALAAIILLGVAYFSGQNMADLTARGLRAQGVVTRVESEWGSNQRTVYYAYAKFNDAAGQAVEFKDKFGFSTPLNHSGDTVGVLYRAADPAGAIIDHGIWNWIIPIVFAFVGGFILFATIQCFIGIARREVKG